MRAVTRVAAAKVVRPPPVAWVACHGASAVSSSVSCVSSSSSSSVLPSSPSVVMPVRAMATAAPAKKGNPMAGPAVEPILPPPINTKSPRQLDDTPKLAPEKYGGTWKPKSKPVWNEQPKYNHYKYVPKHVVQRLQPGDPDNYEYRLKAGTLVERPPICFGPQPLFEQKWEELKKRLAPTHTRTIPEELLEPLRKKRTGDDAEDEQPEIKPNPLRTEDDRLNNRKSLYRALDTSLFLIVKKDRAENAWQFPMGAFEPTKEVHLRQTAFRELQQDLGTEMRFHMMGNCPIGHIKYDYSESAKSKDPEFKGAKVFFFHAFRTSGDPDLMTVVNTAVAAAGPGLGRRQAALLKPTLIDYAWVTKDELLNEYFQHDKQLTALCKDMIIAVDRD